MRPAGYLVNTGGGIEGEPGQFYDYILAQNGLFIRAQNPLLEATVLIAPAEARGLRPLREGVRLTRGKMPRYLYDLAISVLCADRLQERYAAVTWHDGYHLEMPPQEGRSAGVSYERLPGTALDIHSHGAMKAFFSMTDNQDEQGLGLYMVVGKLDTLIPEVLLRVGVYGYFAPIETGEVFD